MWRGSRGREEEEKEMRGRGEGDGVRGEGEGEREPKRLRLKLFKHIPSSTKYFLFCSIKYLNLFICSNLVSQLFFFCSIEVSKIFFSFFYILMSQLCFCSTKYLNC